ncbi:MAG: biotin--[Prevotella sp.]|nr:biotin--[acetyl-CoA-carboxylase] ligase [Prevotella sp.]
MLYFCKVEWKIVHIDETDSTNRWLREQGGEENMVVWADYQTAGRGCGTNHWESERGKNLTFSMLLHPHDVPAQKQFHISMAISLALCKALGQHIGDLSIKWPNDIYWRDGKIGGILIEVTLLGNKVKDCIIGIGLNINQRVFRSDAPNPVSMWQICEQETDCEQLLQEILQAFQEYMGKSNKDEYQSMLYRRKGFHPYADKDGAFMAEIIDVEDDGHLLLRDDNGQLRRYAFKEVTFVI